ncbi:MAG: CotH kinase family protein [Oscillibacter sp.]|nr:CotH kinase family protein [Oscillibacter sp.]
MKRIVIGLLVCALCVGLAATATVVDFERKESRIHQHLEAGEKAPCSHEANLLCTHLPLVEIETGGHPIPGAPVLDDKGFIVDYTVTEADEPRLKASLEITDNAETNHHVTDAPSLATSVLINIRGRSSREFDKKSYRITLIYDDGTNNNQSVMGMDAHHEWVLHGPFLDKSLIRNYMMYNLAGECMEYAPNVRFCEVVIDGSYQGLYLMTESITKGYDGSRLTMEVKKKDNTFSGYILRVNDIYPFEETTSVISDYGNYAYVARIPVEVIYPGTINQTAEMRRKIELEFSAFEKALYSYDYDSEDYGYTQWIDIPSFVDYYILNEFVCNIDAGRLSTYVYKDTSGKYKICVWDFNNACDNYMELRVNLHDFDTQNRLLYHMLCRDEDFTEAIITRYKELRQSVLSEEYLMNYIDQTVAYLGPAIERNFDKWGYSFQAEYSLLKGEDREICSYDEAISQLKEFLIERGNWMDQNIDAVREFSAESAVKKYNENAD